MCCSSRPNERCAALGVPNPSFSLVLADPLVSLPTFSLSPSALPQPPQQTPQDISLTSLNCFINRFVLP